jgi:DNA transposition AAA+ family ATPase
MKNIYGKNESLKLYNDKGVCAYEYQKGSYFTYEYTYDDYGNTLTYKNSKGDGFEFTRDSEGKVLTYENSKGTRRGFDQVKAMTTENRIKAKKTKSDLLLGILIDYIGGFDKLEKVLKDSNYTEACDLIDKHYEQEGK